MKIKIIKGINKIGGCITEIATKNTKIIIDFGQDLQIKEDIQINGLTFGKSIYDAVLITHSHSDHIGLINKINKDILIYMEEKTKLIYDISCDFMNIEKINRNIYTFDINNIKPILIGDIKITPYIIDHSAYNSCMFLIESDDKRILHTGDFRNHGRKHSLFIPTLKEIGNIDLLITEGTTISRNDSKYKSEYEIEKEAKEIFKKYNQVLVMNSSTNIDRLVSFYKARGNKKIVYDTFTSAITEKLENIPNINYKDIYKWNPNIYNRIKDDEFKTKYMNNKYNYDFLPNFIMYVKTSMLPDIKKLNKLGLLNNTCLIYSMWDGYIEKDESLQNFINELKKMNIDFIKLHTSGHADIETLKKLEEILKPKEVIVIHTNDNLKGKTIFKNYRGIKENETLIL